ncbi:hypothetical protein OC844_005226 [Tilletia horrida]|nr:hypothetical protein OC844_005226 [Tilletia horrida]
MDSLADPTPIANAIGPQIESLQAVLSRLLPSASASSSSASPATALPAYEDLIAAIESSTGTGDSGNALTGRLHAARMHASLAYLLLDALWILMKTRGITLPAHHPLHAELERARKYVGKIKHASEGGGGGGGAAGSSSSREKDAVQAAQEGPQRRVEQGPAGRFVRAALASNNSSAKGKLTKFADDEDEEEAEMVVDYGQAQAKHGKRKAGGGGGEGEMGTLEEDPRRKKSAIMDPYTEFDAEPEAPPAAAPSSPASLPLPSKPKRKGSTAEDDDDEDGEDEDEDDDNEDADADRSTGKEKKKRTSKKRKSRGRRGSKGSKSGKR